MNIRNNTGYTQNIEIDAVKRTLLTAADAAAAITLPAFRSGLSVDNKEQHSFDPVTEADRAAEQAIRAVIEKQFPDHCIIGEEFDNKITDSPFSWVIDPIDGTRAFISGVPVWGTLIGLSYEDKTFAGVMTQPFIGETFLGLPGCSTYQRNQPAVAIKTSNVTRLQDAIKYTTTPSLFEGNQLTAYRTLESKVRLSRYGTDCYAYALLACGHVDLVVEPRLNIYDIAALIPIIQNAGGVITNFKGGAPDQGGDIIAAATPQLHQATMEIMNS